MKPTDLAGWDKYGSEVAKEVSCYLPVGIRKGDTVMDVGAHHGHFALLAAREGAVQVCSYEPAPENLVYLRQNTQDVPQIELHEYALGREKGIRELWLNPGRNTGAHSLIKRRGREPVEVMVRSFTDEVKEIRPDIIKIDIEGAEYELDLDCLGSVRGVAIELHLQGNQRIEAQRVHRYIRSLGFTVVRQPTDTGRNWHTFSIYRKDAVVAST